MAVDKIPNEIVHSLLGHSQFYLSKNKMEEYLNKKPKKYYKNDMIFSCFQRKYHTTVNVFQIKRNWENLFYNYHINYVEYNGMEFVKQGSVIFYYQKINKQESQFKLNIWKDDVCRYGDRCFKCDDVFKQKLYGDCQKLHYITNNDICYNHNCAKCNKLHLPKNVE